MRILWVVERINWDALEASPANGKDEWIVRLQGAVVPSVAFDAHLYVSEALLRGQQSADNDRVRRVEVLDHLARDVVQLNADVLAWAETLNKRARLSIHAFKLSAVRRELLGDLFLFSS